MLLSKKSILHLSPQAGAAFGAVRIGAAVCAPDVTSEQGLGSSLAVPPARNGTACVVIFISVLNMFNNKGEVGKCERFL